MGVRYRAYSASSAQLRRLQRKAKHEDELPPLLGDRAALDPSRLGHRDVLKLQRLAGNQAVSQMAAQRGSSPRDEKIDGGSDSTFSLDILVARREGPARQPAPEEAPRRPALVADAAEAGEEPKEAISSEGSAVVEESDAVAPSLTYSGTVGARATAPSAELFGVTSTDVKMTGLTAAAVPAAAGAAAGTFKVTGGADVSAKWSVHSRGRIDVPYFAAPAVTATTYPKVASDLKPNMASDGGRPPRREYWAQDLTERHEQFHANERTGKYGRAAFEFAKTWLASQSASTADEATTLAKKVPAKMFESYDASFAPGKEDRAYGDGASAYRVRSEMAHDYGEELKKKAAGGK